MLRKNPGNILKSPTRAISPIGAAAVLALITVPAAYVLKGELAIGQGSEVSPEQVAARAQLKANSINTQLAAGKSVDVRKTAAQITFTKGGEQQIIPDSVFLTWGSQEEAREGILAGSWIGIESTNANGRVELKAIPLPADARLQYSIGPHSLDPHDAVLNVEAASQGLMITEVDALGNALSSSVSLTTEESLQ